MISSNHNHKPLSHIMKLLPSNMLHSTFGTFMRRTLFRQSVLEITVAIKIQRNLNFWSTKPFKWSLVCLGLAWLYIWLFNSYLPASLTGRAPHKKLTHTSLDLLCLGLYSNPLYLPAPIWIEWENKNQNWTETQCCRKISFGIRAFQRLKEMAFQLPIAFLLYLWQLAMHSP